MIISISITLPDIEAKAILQLDITGIKINLRTLKSALRTSVYPKLAVMIELILQPLTAALTELSLTNLPRASCITSLRAADSLTDAIGNDRMPALLRQKCAQRVITIHDNLHIRSHVESLLQKIHRDIDLTVPVKLISEQIRQYAQIRLKMRKHPDS